MKRPPKVYHRTLRTLRNVLLALLALSLIHIYAWKEKPQGWKIITFLHSFPGSPCGRGRNVVV